MKPALRNIVKSTDYSSYGGAILLGVNAPVVKGHGSSNAKAFSVAILQTAYMVKQDVVGTIRTAMEERKAQEEAVSRHGIRPGLSFLLNLELVDAYVSEKGYERLQEKLGYRFSDVETLKRALTHSSFDGDKFHNNQAYGVPGRRGTPVDHQRRAF